MTTVLPVVSKLSPRVIRILGCNPGKMTLQGTNTYILGTGKKRVLVDTGEQNKPQYINELKKVLTENGIMIEKVLISHWHGDHLGGLSEVGAILNNDFTAWKFPRSDAVENNSSVQDLKDGEEILVEGASLKVHHTPGHSTDHVVLHLKEENAIFSGDCILGEGTTVFEDLYDYMKSLKLLLNLNPDIIYPGHGPVIETPSEKILYYINHRNEREHQIKHTLEAHKDSGLTIAELTKLIYKDVPENLLTAAAGNVDHHLKKLEKEGIVFVDEYLWKLK